MDENNCKYIRTINDEELRKKRMKVLLHVWEYLTQKKILSDNFTISPLLLNEVVEHYLADVKIIKCRYNIKDKIQLHKIAGLMTGIIIRYRPILPQNDQKNINSTFIFANELFAVTHGLAICGEYNLDVCEKIANEAWFDIWLNDFFFLLHKRNYTSESLVFIYQTLSHMVFPDNFKVLDM